MDFILSCTSRVISVDWFGGVVLEPEDEAHLVLRQGRGEVAGQLHRAPRHAAHRHRLV